MSKENKNSSSSLYDDTKLNTINSMMIAVLLTSNFISTIFASLNIKQEGILPIIIIFAVITSYISGLFIKNKVIKFNKYSLLFIYIIFITFILTFLFNKSTYSADYFIQFLGFGFTIYLLSLLPFSAEKIIRYTMYIGNFILLNPLGFLELISLNTEFARIDMGASYAILPSIVAAILHFVFLRRNKLFDLISYLSNIYLLIILFTTGTRGALLAIILLICIIIYIKQRQKIKDKANILTPLLFIIISTATLFIVWNIETILLSIYMLLFNLGIESATIIKTVNLINENGIVGILNDRESVYGNALYLIKSSPVWGNGIGSYADHYNGTYPHNLFLQLLVEGGVLLLLPFLIIITLSLGAIIKPFKTKYILDSNLSLIIFLFVISIPRLMLSSYLWQNQAIWLLIFVFIAKYMKSPDYVNKYIQTIRDKAYY